jgi:hypothetical protein
MIQRERVFQKRSESSGTIRRRRRMGRGRGGIRGRK